MPEEIPEPTAAVPPPEPVLADGIRPHDRAAQIRAAAISAIKYTLVETSDLVRAAGRDPCCLTISRQMAEAEVRRPKLTLQWEKAQYALDRKYRRLLSQLLKSVEDHPDKLQKRVREVRESLETARVVEIQARLGPKYLRIPSRKVILKGPLKSVGGVLI